MTNTLLHSDQEQSRALQEHYPLLYRILAESKLVPQAVFETVDHGLQRCLSGISFPTLNTVIGCPINQKAWDTCIEEQLQYFKAAKLPFVWYVNEEDNPEFKEKLISYGFQDPGMFQGVIGKLDYSIPNPEVPQNCTLELVSDEQTLEDFNELVCHTFGFQGDAKFLFKQALVKASQNSDLPMLHWVVRKHGKVVSTVSTLIQGNQVSLWNGATALDLRGQGLSTALYRLALKDAMSKGCQIGMAFLMSEGLALGICQKLGYQTKWRFHAFLYSLAH